MPGFLFFSSCVSCTCRGGGRCYTPPQAKHGMVAMRGLVAVVLSMAAFGAQASPQCQDLSAQPMAVRPTVLAPVVAGFAVVNPQLGSQRGVLAPAYDESQSLDNVLWRLKVEDCRSLAAVPAAAAGPAGYVKKTEFDNTPYRFNMTQNGRRMTADDFDAWLQANGYSAGRRVDPNAQQQAPAEAAPQQ